MISIIVAVAQNGVIGGNNELLWHISEDLQRFKATTMSHPIIMGRKTFESLGKALPGRHNVVITRNPNYKAEGATVVGSLREALELFPSDEEVFITGGAQIYKEALPLADKFYLTVVYADYEGDTHFPEWNEEDWIKESSEYHERGAKFPHPFEYINYVRKK